jgi:hypothetical protein
MKKMNMSELKSRFIRNLSNIAGWRTNRKILVIESDDWGSIRMPSIEVYNLLRAEGINVTGGDSKRYNLYDTLASYDDLKLLFELLSSFKDKVENSCVFTAICVVANPDFQKIKGNNFREYYYEPFSKTLSRYYHDNKSFELWNKGIASRIFVPQFHGREHLNVAAWMRALQRNDRETLLGFEHGVWGYNPKSFFGSPLSYLAAFDLYDPGDLTIQDRAITEGLDLFHELFGYEATFFVPPNGPFNTSLEKTAAKCGIKYISTAKIQIEPQGNGKKRKILHWLGQHNKYNQCYTVRNCIFEPSQSGKDWVSSCLRDIEIAFRWHKPAIISTHRVNYIGTLSRKNRENGLRQLKLLLTSILKNWPDIEFMTSDQLGDLICSD